MASWRPLRKNLSYRDLLGNTLASHTDHWRGFTWEAGPFVVTHEGGDWGRVQVWAASREEGIRVISHAAAIAGQDVNCPNCEWYVHLAQNPRYGRTGTMQTRTLPNGVIAVTKRMGPSGSPEYQLPE